MASEILSVAAIVAVAAFGVWTWRILRKLSVPHREGILTTPDPEFYREHVPSKGRYYFWDDEPYISVTNAIEHGTNKWVLIKWAAKMVAEFVAENLETVQMWRDTMEDKPFTDTLKRIPWDYRDTRGEEGSEIHEIIYRHTLGDEIPMLSLEKAQRARMRQWLSVMDTFRPTVIAAECVVWNQEHYYAGTLDAIWEVTIDGARQTLLVDYKTSKRVYPEAALQLAAYRHADFLTIEDGTMFPMPKVDGAVVVHLTTRTWNIVPVDTEVGSFNAFLHAVGVARWSLDDQKGAIGEKIKGAAPKDVLPDTDPFEGVAP